MTGKTINPTRMELTRLKGRLKTAQRGHKLLKDKRDELMKQFMEVVRRNRQLRAKVEQGLKEANAAFTVAAAIMGPEMLEQALLRPRRRVSLEVGSKNIMSVNTPVYTFHTEGGEDTLLPYGFAQTSGELDAALEKMRRARTLFREEDYAGCLALFAQDAPSGDEMLLLCSQAAGMLAAQRLAAENFSGAKELAQQALDWNRRSLYASAQVQVQALDVLARCAIQEKQADEAVERYRTFYLERQSAVRYHFTMARFHLQQEHIQAAEREIWSIAELPDAQRAEYLILRGKIASRREQYENAALYFHQAQELPLQRLLERELYEGLEVCCRELGDYQQAYLYASKQLAMQKETGKETRT